MFLVFLSHFLIKYTHLFNIITVYSSYYKYSHLKVTFLDVLELSVISHDHHLSHICLNCVQQGLLGGNQIKYVFVVTSDR